MRRHKGVRPHDVIVLLKMSHTEDKRQQYLADQLYMSQSEISDSLSRSKVALLTDSSRKNVHVNNLLEFLTYGLKYCFPCIPGRIVRGIPTSHSVPPLSEYFNSEQIYVWPDPLGEFMGQSIEPLHKNQHLAVKIDPMLYQKLSLIDAIRLRNPRETQLAISELNKRFSVNA